MSVEHGVPSAAGLVAVVGPPAVGKSTVTSALANRFGATAGQLRALLAVIELTADDRLLAIRVLDVGASTPASTRMAGESKTPIWARRSSRPGARSPLRQARGSTSTGPTPRRSGRPSSRPRPRASTTTGGCLMIPPRLAGAATWQAEPSGCCVERRAQLVTDDLGDGVPCRPGETPVASLGSPHGLGGRHGRNPRNHARRGEA